MTLWLATAGLFSTFLQGLEIVMMRCSDKWKVRILPNSR